MAHKKEVLMIKREIQKELKKLLKEYPVVVILGPRQAGKTTLAKTLPYAYCNLEYPENRYKAVEDPKAFFRQFKSSVILDEIQNVPILLSYIQAMVDQKNKPGQFVLTGSYQPALVEGIAQSLAGRVGLLNLLPLSLSELEKAGIKYDNFYNYAHRGFLPRVYDQKQRPFQAYSNYYRTYIERDIRKIIHLQDQNVFETFMRLLAGRAGQILNYNSLASDVGVSVKTIKNWLSVLSASFIIYRLNPYFENFRKRIVKSPKYYFIETGLLCFLLGLEKKEQIVRDPLVGSIFENMVVMECVKSLCHQGRIPEFYFFRDSNGNEIDLLFKSAGKLKCFEIKSAETYQPAMSKKLKKIKQLNKKIQTAGLIYNGSSLNLSRGLELINFKSVRKHIK